ncbi:MAG: Hsp70 family protein [Planctomycetales bacterium]|nr:Hsp70 family protein [Planctomycetales bacterium]
MDIGIDLGTTYSVIAVRGEVTLKEDYGQGVYLEELDVTIIPTPDGDATFPSVVWIDPDTGEPLVGQEAKQKAEEGEAPFAFTKRSIGTEKPLTMHGKTYTAKQVATMILKHLKACAEKALGTEITRAVITHPAYFDPNQIQETRQAAVDAGFEMSQPEQMMMEPAAAALAYTRSIETDPLRILVYDLGGGTFDVTILERQDGVILLKAFDGNHLLGGYNFDRAIVQWVLEQLAEKGRKIPYDAKDPEDQARRARLLQIAENVKFKLSEARNDRTFVPVKARDVLIDEAGKKVEISERISREQFKELIEDDLSDTIDRCTSALAKASFEQADLHCILLVGGSTHGPWISEAVGEAFNIEVESHSDVDLCVAAGAALKAAQLPPPPQPSVGGLTIRPSMRPVSTLPTIIVSGEVTSEDGPLPPGLLMHLDSPGDNEPCPCGNGKFLFMDVDLPDEGPNELVVRLTDDEGAELLRQSFQVTYAPDDASDVLYTVLPKPIYVEVQGRLKPVAEEGERLPARPEPMTFRRLHSGAGETTIKVPVHQEETKIGEITVRNIPEDVGENATITINVEITEHNRMIGTAVVKSGDTVVAEDEILIDFPPIELPELHELLAWHKKLERQRVDKEAVSTRPEEKALLKGKARKISSSVEKKFAEQEPDIQEIHELLRNLDRLINPPADDMDPPLADFLSIIAECKQILKQHSSDPQMEPFQTIPDRIEQSGANAFRTKNNREWIASYENAVELLKRLKALINVPPPPPPTELPPTPELKDQMRQLIEAVRGELAVEEQKLSQREDFVTVIKPRADKLGQELGMQEAETEKIPDESKPEAALGRLQMIHQKVERVRRRIPDIQHYLSD